MTELEPELYLCSGDPIVSGDQHRFLAELLLLTRLSSRALCRSESCGLIQNLKKNCRSSFKWRSLYQIIECHLLSKNISPKVSNQSWELLYCKYQISMLDLDLWLIIRKISSLFDIPRMVIALSQGLKPALIRGGITKMKGTGLTGFWTQSVWAHFFLLRCGDCDCIVGIPIAMWEFRLRYGDSDCGGGIPIAVWGFHVGDLIYHDHYFNLIKFNRTQSGGWSQLWSGEELLK